MPDSGSVTGSTSLNVPGREKIRPFRHQRFPSGLEQRFGWQGTIQMSHPRASNRQVGLDDALVEGPVLQIEAI